MTRTTGDDRVDAREALNVSNLAKVCVYVQAKRYKAGTGKNSDVARKLRMAIPSGK